MLYLARLEGGLRWDPVFMHHPVGLLSLGSSTFIEDEGFFHACQF